MKISIGHFVALLTASVPAGAASATPHTLPFTYPNETLPHGQFEGEMYTDVNPLRVAADPRSSAKGNVWDPEYDLTLEAEYGVTDHVELAFYTAFEAPPTPGGDNAFMFDGLKWRMRTRFAEPGQLPIDVGLYLELETMHDEISLEEKLNLQRRFGIVTWMANLWVEESLVRPFDSAAQGRALQFIVNPTTGFTFQVSPSFHAGVEFWARGEPVPSETDPQEKRNATIHAFLGPAISFNFGRFWWSAAAYKNLNTLATPAVGDAWGPVWFRTMLGLEI